MPGSTVGLWKVNHFSCVWCSSPRDDVSPGTGPGCAHVATDPWPCGLPLVHTVSSTADVTVAAPFAQAAPWGGVRPDPTRLTPTQALRVATAAFRGGRKLKGDFSSLSSGSVHSSAGSWSSLRRVSRRTWYGQPVCCSRRSLCAAGAPSCARLGAVWPTAPAPTCCSSSLCTLQLSVLNISNPPQEP